MNFKKHVMASIECDQFLEDKGIISYISELQNFRTNRFVYGKIKRTTAQQIEQEFLVGDDGQQLNVPTISVGSKVVLPESMFWDDLYAFIATSKSFDDDNPDQELTDMSKLPAWMKTDTLYLFKWARAGDTSAFIKEYEAKDFLMVEPMNPDGLKAKYNLRIEMRDSIEFIGTNFAVEIEKWISGLRCAKRCGEENERSKNKITRNIDFIIGMYRRKMGQ